MVFIRNYTDTSGKPSTITIRDRVSVIKDKSLKYMNRKIIWSLYKNKMYDAELQGGS